jgi:hypothetical protein
MRIISPSFGIALFASMCIASSAQAESVLIVNPGFETVSRPLAGGEQTNGIGGAGTLVGTREPFPFGVGTVDWSAPVTVPGWRTFVVPFGSPDILYAGVLRPTELGGTPFVTGIEGGNVLAIQVAQAGQETAEVLQPNTTYTLSFLGGISQFDSNYFFAVTLTAIDDTATLPIENQPGVTRLALGSFFPPVQQPDGVMRRYEFSYTSPNPLPASLVGARVGINVYGSDGIPRVIYDDFTLTAVDAAIPTFCDGTDGSLSSCPCSNAGGPSTGCDIQQGTGGVGLCVVSQETSPQNRVTWQGTGFPSASAPTSIVIRSTALDPAGPMTFGDGLRCIGNPVVRLAATFASGGTVTHIHGHGAMAGSGDFYYQLWFRNTPAMFCTPEAFNLSNGRVLTW